MALSSIGTLSTGANSFYQSVSGGAQSSTLTGVWTPPPAAADSDSPEPEQDTLQVRRSDAESLHQIEAAVNSALSAAQQNTTADPNQIITRAIQQTFQTDAASAAATPTTSSDSSTAGNSSGSGTNDPNSGAATQSFLQALRTYGIDPQQFHGDLLSAVKDAQQGHVDPSTVFANFPVGSSLDAVA